MNKTVKLQDLGLKDFKETWDYQETLFKAILDTKIKNRREDAGLETIRHSFAHLVGRLSDSAGIAEVSPTQRCDAVAHV